MINYFVRSRVAANVLMLIVVVLGLISLGEIRRETFPVYEPDQAAVVVAYPGATAADIEASVVQVIEERLADIDDVKHITSTSRDGSGSVIVEFVSGAAIDESVQTIRERVDGITTFPADVEPPVVSRQRGKSLGAFLQLHGDVDEIALREWAYTVKDRILADGVATQVSIDGARPREIHIEIGA
ncbi:MAG: efflux RND transporter permease subunit, partial [Planctomycetota bacterium]